MVKEVKAPGPCSDEFVFVHQCTGGGLQLQVLADGFVFK